MNFSAITVAVTGNQVVSGAVSATIAIPVTADGVKARYVLVQSNGPAYIKPVVGGASLCTVNDLYLSAAQSVILSVKQFTHLAYLQDAAAVKINITPVEF